MHPKPTRRHPSRALLLGLLTIFLASCQPSAPPAPTQDAALLAEQALATIQAEYTQTAQAIPPTVAPTETPLPAPTAVRTPPALPAIYESPLTHSKDYPHTYIEDTCTYLKARWDPNNSAPGTVAAVVMIHGIIDGEATQANQISKTDSRQLLEDLHAQGFEAITTEEFLNFLEHNAKIPPRSVLLIADDRHYDQYFNTHFRPFYEKYGWNFVNAWISYDDSIATQALPGNIALAEEGWVDYQAHGVLSQPMSDNSSDEYLYSELQGSIDTLQEHFNTTPIAIIWPGGGFGVRPVETARELGYKLGFTINPRGPVMFNWVPLSDEKDEMRPYYLPEGPINDPLMTIPRYWNTDMRAHIDEVRIIGKEAAAYAEQNKAIELEYYDIVCAPTYGAISELWE